MSQSPRTITPERFDAVLFDLDGVLTDTAKVHAACWKKMFDEFLGNRAAQTGESWQPFEIDTDYKQYVDGKLRYEGVRSFLHSREIDLPDGDPSDPAHRETICGLGNRKNELIQEVLATKGVEVYERSVPFVHYLHSVGIRTAVSDLHGAAHRAHPAQVSPQHAGEGAGTGSTSGPKRGALSLADR
jgi:beta-phosphoglucomutase-like phosphatase (HAD superfamily)